MHWSDAGAASWFDVAVAVGELGVELGLLERMAAVTPITTADYPTPAKRPSYSLLDCSSSRQAARTSRKPLAPGPASASALHANSHHHHPMTSSMPTTAELLGNRGRILVTGGAGFIGGAVVRRLLRESTALVFNLDKMGYASDCTSIEQVLTELGAAGEERHQLLQVNLADTEATAEAVHWADPDLVLHLAAESHVDRSIAGPELFIDSNVSGTLHLLQAVRAHWEQLRGTQGELSHAPSAPMRCLAPSVRRAVSQKRPYDPRSPYSASKAASDHLVNAWHPTYGLPVVLTNCSNNYGPWQFPEKLIPVVILKAAAGGRFRCMAMD